MTEIQSIEQGTKRLTYTVKEAAQILGISPGLSYELIRRGQIPVLHLGRRKLVPRHGLEALLGIGGDQR